MRTIQYFAAMIVVAIAMIFFGCPVPAASPTDTTPPVAGAAIGFSGTTASGTTVSWGSATDAVTSAASLRYKLVHSSSAGAIDTVAKVNAIVTSGSGLAMDWTGNALTFSVTGLSDATTYYFAVIVKDAAGNLALYGPAPVTTLDGAAPGVGAAIGFFGTTSSGTTASWGAATDDVTAQASLQYKLVKAASGAAIDTIGEADAITGADLVMDWTANTTTKTVTGLTDSTTHYFAVLVKDAAGNKALYVPASVTTSDGTAPATGTAISFPSTTYTGTMVDWGAATDNVTAQASLQYRVVKAATGAAIDTVAEADAVTGADLIMDWTANTVYKTVTGLSAGTTYYFAVEVRDAAGNKALYTPASVTTTSMPTPLVEYRFENNGNDSVGSQHLTGTGSPTYSGAVKKEGSYSVYLDGFNYLANSGASISVPSGITVSAWINFSTDTNFNTIITLYDGSGSYYYSFCFDDTVDPMRNLALYDASGNNPAACDTSLASGTWYHVVFTVSNSGWVLMYVNGSLVPDNDTAFPNVVNMYISTIAKVEVGTMQNMYGWNGYIDDLRIYNKVLSAAEVAALDASY
jgi:hypothetical protein